MISVLFEKLVRLPKAVIKQHVDARQGQLRVLEGRRRRRRRISVVPPPRPLLLGAGHGSARLCAQPRRGGVGRQLLRPPRAPGARLYLPGAQRSRAAGRGGARRGGEGGAVLAAARRGTWAPRPPPPAAAGDYSAAARPRLLLP